MPELIDDARTGFVVESIDEAVAAVSSAGNLDRQAIRRCAVTRFGIDRMVDAYLDVYRRVLLGER
jgi:glycosyltransferase involved in cell wall biosynthesis